MTKMLDSQKKKKKKRIPEEKNEGEDRERLSVCKSNVEGRIKTLLS